MCGILGICLHNQDINVCGLIIDGLTMLQHRGQDAAGMITCKDGVLHMVKHNGLVRDVFGGSDMTHIVGPVGLGHVRYPTAGSSSSAEAQPFYTNSPFGICMAHNGNLTNHDELRKMLMLRGMRHLNTESDSEVLMNVFALELLRHPKTAELFAADASTPANAHEIHPSPDVLFDAIKELMIKCKGGYAAAGMLVNRGLFGFRDAFGIRPLVIGVSADGKDYVLSSESVAIDSLGFTVLRDVRPGEAVFVDGSGKLHSRVCHPNPCLSPCIFEYVYLSRPDSVLDGVSVYQARMRMGITLAGRIKQRPDWKEIDVVVPVPDTSRPSAHECANYLGIRYREAIIKNRYIARTFIMPGQTVRRKGIRMKLSPIRAELENLNVLLIDDSIVRGNTAQQIVAMVRQSGARKVFVASAAPAVKYPNVYGIDMPTSDELIASTRSDEEVAKELGADWVVYQTVADMEESVRGINPDMTTFESSCFTGEYVTGDVSPAYLAHVENSRNEMTRNGVANKRQKTQTVVEMHNSTKSGMC